MTDDKIARLLTLARDRSREARAHLVDNITDLFLSDEGRLSEQERALMSDILAKLIDQVERDVRKQLAEALARSGADYPDLVKLLASDEVDIARPLLEKSTLLRDPDLIEIVRIRTDEHRLAIAMREGLSQQVSDALVEYGSEDVIEALLNNADARLSASAMEYLVAESRRVDRFQEPLLGRDDLPGDLAYRMYWWVSAALRQRILDDFDVDPLVVENAVSRATRTAIVDHKSSDSARVRAQKLVRRMREGGELSISFLTTALRQQRVAVFVAGLAELAGITFETAWRIFSDTKGQSFTILARAIGMDRNQFTTLALLILQARDGSNPRETGILANISKLFQSVTMEQAKAALQVWQRDNAYQNAIEELERLNNRSA
ncbi:DUF2336 domain-containing protein [Yunchengibacter salinarum]|uniref:DUF2336 domain-containing protein n=1 Tax=Yunchengibacter salinarum TaxID=3133399 RepID=UPI0035B6538C